MFMQRVIRNTLRNYAKYTRSVATVPKPPKKVFQGMTWKSVGISLGISGCVLAYMMYLRDQKRLLIDKERQRSIGKASIGGQFELVDTNGKIRTSEEFLDNWLLIYFGFTHCPDICPDELEKMSKVLESLDKPEKDFKIKGIFISVDPERDTPEIVGKYVKEFSPRLLGLTGSSEQVEKACKAYRVYFSAGPKDSDADYIVDHTIIMYLVNPKGEFVDYYGQTKDHEEIVTSIMVNKAKYDQINKTGWFT